MISPARQRPTGLAPAAMALLCTWLLCDPPAQAGPREAPSGSPEAQGGRWAVPAYPLDTTVGTMFQLATPGDVTLRRALVEVFVKGERQTLSLLDEGRIAEDHPDDGVLLGRSRLQVPGGSLVRLWVIKKDRKAALAYSGVVGRPGSALDLVAWRQDSGTRTPVARLVSAVLPRVRVILKPPLFWTALVGWAVILLLILAARSALEE